MGLEQLIEKAQGYLPPERVALIKDAYDYAEKAHRGQKRKSGEPFIEHPLQTALILVDLQLDATTLAAALLHDVPENCGVPIPEIEAKFGPEVAKLVDGATKLGKISLHTPAGAHSKEQAENLRKMLVAMAQDLRVVFIKLADRLHNMRTLQAMPPETQGIIAQETLEIYTPLAHRLGIWELKWQLEDLSFRYIEPDKYHQIAKLVAARRAKRESFIAQVIQILQGEYQRANLDAEVSGRPKHIYSIYQKIEKYAAQDKQFDDIHDLLALRVLVNTVPECYHALGIIHSLWHPLPGEFNDFIANPKPNGYQSLHTTVLCLGTTPLEIQIRTREMHHVDEYGLAAHWRYKEGQTRDTHFEEKVAWLRQLIDWHREMSGAEEFLESVKTDIFIDQVFVYTPKGEIKDLPKGATSLDFAYRVHTELGHRCIGAKVNGKLVPLNCQLNNGDVVEIMTSKIAKGPSRDWLNPNLGFVNTAQARTKIRQWFKRQERVENIDRGREYLDKEMRHLGIKTGERETLAKLFKYDNLDDFLAAIGDGGISISQIAVKLAAQQAAQPPAVKTAPVPAKTPETAIRVLGMADLVTHVARCCHPLPGDKIIGYITRSRGVTIHRRDCYNIEHEDEKERLIAVAWERNGTMYPVDVKIEAVDRVGLIRDITTVIAEEKVNITNVSSPHPEGQAVSEVFTLYVSVETSGLVQLSRLLKKVEGVRGVINISRVGDEAALKPK
jgi:GTP diphosphokinase / guanosine-3',5'-bis(diphosphate) 3'-diphosphatase